MSDVGDLVDRLLAGAYPPSPPPVRDHRWEFDAAVDKLMRAGISRSAAEGLMNRAVDRREASLDQWADHLVRVRTEGAKVWGS